MRMRSMWLVCLVMVLAVVSAAQQKDVVMQAMRDEMARSMQGLSLPDSPRPHFIAYRVDMMDVNVVGASLGSLLPLRPQRADMIGVEVRVGSPELDNTNFVSMSLFSGGPSGLMRGMRTGPLNGDYAAVRRELWHATDEQYKRAVEDYAAKKAVLENRRQSEPVPDFTREQPANWSEAPPPARHDDAAEQLARELSAIFRKYPQLYTSSVEITLRSGYTRYLNSDGSWFMRADRGVKLQVKAETQAGDGMPLGDTYEIYAKSLEELPSKADLSARVETLASRLQQLRAAKSLERYSGPVLFEDAAAAEVFAHIFAPALVAVREPLSDNEQIQMLFQRFLGQSGSLIDRIGGRVLPTTISVVDDPTLTDLSGAKLPVSSHIDDDGVPTRKTTLVDRGVLKALLTSRTPVRTMLKSTGSRRAVGPSPTTLLVSAEKGLSSSQLRQELMRRVKENHTGYGIVVRRVGRGKLSDSFLEMVMRMAGRESAVTDSLFEVYRVYADGREELLRGVQIEGLTRSSFKEIAAVGDKPVLFTDEFMPLIGGSFFSGLSTAAGEGMPVVNYSVPSLLFEEVSLKSVQGSFPTPPVTASPLMQTASK